MPCRDLLACAVVARAEDRIAGSAGRPAAAAQPPEWSAPNRPCPDVRADMMSVVSPAPRVRLPRRAVLISAGSAAALVTAGCNPFSATTRTTRTVVQTAPPPID